MLFALGLGEQVVAVGHECDYPVEAAHLPRATFSHVDSAAASDEIDQQVKRLSTAGQPLYGIDRELLASLQPDLIVTQSQCDVCAVRHQDVLDLVASQPALADTRVLAMNPQSLGDVLDDIDQLGEATDSSDSATALIAELNSRISRVRSITHHLPPQDILAVVVIEWIEPLMLAANWTPELVTIAGGINGLTTPEQHSEYHAWDEVVEFNPDVIVVAPCGFDLPRTLTEAETLASLPGWSDLAAVQSGRVWALDGNAYLNRPGPRLVETVEILAHVFHPEHGGLAAAVSLLNAAFQNLT